MNPTLMAAAAAAAPDNGDIFLWEMLGTFILILLGCGVVANVILPKTKGNSGGWLLINFGWGLAVMSGVYVAYNVGAHLNPAVTVGLWATGDRGLEIDNVLMYILGQMVGAFVGAVAAWAVYKDHFDQEAPAATKLAVFSTGPEIRNPVTNFITEVIATFVLVFVIITAGSHGVIADQRAWPIAVGLLVVGIGASLGGPTGYAINPARDLAPRIAHTLLPIPGKGDSDWGYSWIPVAGPLVGGLLAGLLGNGLF